MQNFSVLPTDLQNIVLDFAYNLERDAIVRSLETILEIKTMHIPFFFFRKSIWSWFFRKYVPNPINVFLPIELIGGRYNDLFDEDSMYCLLLGLDFRRRNVRLLGSREDWLNRIYTSWRAVEPLAAYYRMLMRCNSAATPIMKQKPHTMFTFF